MSYNLSYIYSSFKFYTFLHFKIMTSDLKISEFSGIFFILYSTFQNISLIFTAYLFAKVPIHALFINFISFLKIFQPLTVIESLNLAELIPLLYYFLIFLSIIMIIYFIILHYNLGKIKEQRYFGFHFLFLELFGFLSMIWLFIPAMPIFQIYYSGIYCLIEEYVFSSETIDFETPLECSSINDYFFVLNIIFASPLIIYGYLSALLFSVETFEIDNNLSNSASNLNIITFIYKCFLVVINFQLSFVNPVAMFAILLFFQLTLVKILLSSHNLFNFRIEKIQFTTYCIEFYTSIYFIFLIILNNNNIQTLNFEIVYFLILILLIKISLHSYDYYLLFLLEGDFSNFKSPYMFDKKLKFLYYFIIKQDIQNEVIIFDYHDSLSYVVKGFFANHAHTCLNVDCLCHTNAPQVYDYKLNKDFLIIKDNRSENFHNIIYIKHFFKSQYSIFIRNFREVNSSTIKLKISYFLSFVVKNYHKSVVDCIEIKDLKHKNILTFQEEFLLERLLMDMDSILLNLNRNYDKNPIYSNLNFEELIQYELNFHKMEKSIQEYASILLNYFSGINDERPQFDELSKISQKLSSLKREIFITYMENRNNPRSIAFYKEYLKALLFSEYEETNLNKVLKIKDEKIQNYKRDGKLIYDVELMYNENSILIQISTTNSSLGNILRANQGAAKYIGYSIAELESSNIDIIMPKRIHENHDQYLRNYMESGRGNVLYKERKLFLRKRDGFLSFISLIAKPMFEIDKNLFKFIGYMQPMKDEYELIVTDETGIIDGMSRKLGFHLKILPKDFEKEKIYIQNLCPSLGEYYFERAKNNRPLYEYEFRNHPKSNKMFPILKFFQYSDCGSTFKYQIDTVMRSLGNKILIFYYIIFKKK